MPDVDSKKFLNYAGVSHLWEQIKSRLDTKLESVTASDASIAVSGAGLDKSLAVNISATAGNALSLKSDGLYVEIPTAAEYTIVRDTSDTAYAAVYSLQKDGVDVGAAINIPRDMVVQSGAVVTDPAGQAAGTYIELTLANATNDKVYVNVGDLIEYVTSGSTSTDSIVVAVSNDHKVTATITDGTIAESKLDAATQAKIDAGASALQASDITTGSTSGTISVDGTDVAVNGLGSAAYENTSAFDVAGAAATAQAAVIGADGDAATANTVYGAKAYADSIVADANDDLIGASTDAATANTIYGAKNYALSLFENGALTNAEIDQAIAEAEA